MEKTPKYAITQGIKNVLQAKEIIAMAKGKGKAKAVNEIVNGVYTKNCPISVLKNHPKATVYTDEEAFILMKKLVNLLKKLIRNFRIMLFENYIILP